MCPSDTDKFELLVFDDVVKEQVAFAVFDTVFSYKLQLRMVRILDGYCRRVHIPINWFSFVGKFYCFTGLTDVNIRNTITFEIFNVLALLLVRTTDFMPRLSCNQSQWA